MIKGASPILNGLYTPFDSPVPGGQKPKREGLTNLLGGGLAEKFQALLDKKQGRFTVPLLIVKIKSRETFIVLYCIYIL